ncbi:MAG TPA: thiamine diphosphokinase [Oscillospiraceae bacterium]|nr:thiamine diphosphokinase [Oscillospiraceae bacterium]HPS33808.1 thiamine diphosphokinase [Oscillospiraceae bacterium]
MPTCYIFGAGEHYGPPPVPAPGDLVIAADGGLIYLEQHGLAPDLVVGDFDSLSEKPASGVKTVVLPKKKDDTDMVAALREGKNSGFRVFHIYGGTGGRLDHTLANIQCIADLAQQGCKGYLFDRDAVITAIHNDKLTFPATAQGTVSAFAHTEVCTGVYERGLKYPLTDATLYNTYPLGVSNEFTGVLSEISVREGTLIVIYPKEIKLSF